MTLPLSPLLMDGEYEKQCMRVCVTSYFRTVLHYGELGPNTPFVKITVVIRGRIVVISVEKFAHRYLTKARTIQELAHAFSSLWKRVRLMNDKPDETESSKIVNKHEGLFVSMLVMAED